MIGWLYKEDDKYVTYANNTRAIEELKSKGWIGTDESYAVYWLLDNGFEYIPITETGISRDIIFDR